MWNKVYNQHSTSLVLPADFHTLIEFHAVTKKGKYQMDNNIQIMDTRCAIPVFSYWIKLPLEM